MDDRKNHVCYLFKPIAFLIDGKLLGQLQNHILLLR